MEQTEATEMEEGEKEEEEEEYIFLRCNNKENSVSRSRETKPAI